MYCDMGLDVTNSSSSELRWKPIKRGRSSRKSSSKVPNVYSKPAVPASTRGVSVLSGSVSNKFDEGLPRKSISGKLEIVPIKKRIHFLRKDSIFRCSSPSSEDNGPLDHRGCFSGDFSGIELLAAAAVIDDSSDICAKEISVAEDSLQKPETTDTPSAASPPAIFLKINESGLSSSNMTEKGGNSDCSVAASDSAFSTQNPYRSTENGIQPKASSRQHWDLNVLMDAWDEPLDPMAGSKGFNDDTNLEMGPVDSSDCVSLNADGGVSPEFSNLKVDEDNSKKLSTDKACISISSTDAQQGFCSVAAYRDNGATENRICGRIEDKALCSDTLMEALDQAINIDEKHVSCYSSESCCRSGTCVSDGNVRSSCDGADEPNDGPCSGKLPDGDRSGTSNKIDPPSQTLILKEMAEPAELQFQGYKDSCASVQDAQSLLISVCKDQIHESFTGSAKAACKDLPVLSVRVPDNEDGNHLSEEPKRTVVEGSSKSFIAGSLDGTMPFNESPDSAKNSQHDLDIPRSHYTPMAEEHSLTAIEEKPDSPYEDGELRGVPMYSWEDIECVDYESDGRKDDENDKADCRVFELAEGGSDVSHGSEAYEGPISPIENFIKIKCADDEVVGKGSNAGSGTTFDRSMETMEENVDSRRRRKLTDASVFYVKLGETNEYPSNVSRGKFPSRFEARASMDVADMNSSTITPSCRSRRHGGSYSLPKRDFSADKYLGRLRSAQGAADGTQWTSWSLRRRRASDHQISEPHGPNRHADYYSSKGLQRSIMRRSSIERDDYVGARRRMHLSLGGSNLRSRGHYVHHSDRGFEDFTHPCDGTDASVRFPHTSSRRDQRFSPVASRCPEMNFPRRPRSRSRSRSQSPRMWHPQRERAMARRHSRSPDYRMERKRVPFFKAKFAASYEEASISASRSRIHSPQDNYGFTHDSAFPENHLKRRRSLFSRPQRFDGVHLAEPNEYYRSGIRRGRFSYVDSGKGHKLDSDYDDRRRDGGARVLR